MALLPTGMQAQNTEARNYTKEQPLVYEDSWDLWPYAFLNENGEPDGYSVDLVRLICKELKIPYIIRMKPTQEALNDLKEGRSDLMLGLAAGFHDEYGQYGQTAITLFTQSVVTHKGQTDKVHTFKDLSRYKVITFRGSLCQHLMEDYGWGDNVIPSDDMREAIQKVSADESGQIVWNTLSLKWLLRKYQIDNLELTPVDMPHGEYKFMSNDPQLLSAIDSIYTVLNSAEELTAIQNKWFYPERNEEGVKPWVWGMVAAILLIALLLVYYLINYRFQERRMRKIINMRNKRLALILETSKVRMWTYDVNSKVFTWRNENGQAAYTYTSEDFSHRYHPEDFKRLLDTLQRMANQEMEETQMNIKARDTEDGDTQYHDFAVALSVLRHDKSGKPAIILGTKRDVTEEQNQQRLERDRELRYWAIFNTHMVGITFYDKDGILVNINSKACEIYCCERDEILAEHVSYRDMLDIDLDMAEADGYYATQCVNLDRIPDEQRKVKSCKRKGKLYNEIRLMTVCDDQGQLIGMFALGRDVTGTVTSNAQRQALLERTKSVVGELTDYVKNINYVLSAGGVRIASYSPDSHTLTIFSGINEVQLALTQTRCMTLVDDRSKKRAMHMLNSMDNRTTNTIDTDITTGIRVGGLMLQLEFHFIPTYDDNGRLTEYFGLCRDVTQLRDAEQQLALHTAKAQEVENAKNSFLKNMSHEIRTPLNAVVGFAELFGADHASEDEGIFVKEILDNSDRLLSLINDILFLSRLDAHMIEIRKEPCNFAAVFESHCHDGWAKYQKPGVNYIIENPYQELVVDIDATNLGHVIEQITANAAQYTESGTVRARYDYIGRRLMISIDDTGAGIPKEYVGRIYERFVSAPNGGSGLGLPICKELTEQMGGTLEINSEVGLGTTVWITIPCLASDIKRKKII